MNILFNCRNESSNAIEIYNSAFLTYVYIHTVMR